ncbi:MAG: alpha/beta fold hydrolase [Opitutaceae bacterium]|nr:alpha/beta fold hydrolase [Opitutaceae bacterium]
MLRINPAMSLLRLLLLLSLCCAPMFSRELDLKREVPVAPDQKIPTEDFFRDSLLRSPQINPGGTHVSAIVSNAQDRTALLLFEIATKKIEILQGDGTQDIFWTSWLDDKHVIFTMSVAKLYGIGYMVGKAGKLTESYPILQYTDARLLTIPRKDRLRPLFWIRNVPVQGHGYREAGVCALRADFRTDMSLINLLSAGASSVGYNGYSRVVEDNNAHIEAIQESPKGGVPVGFQLDAEDRVAYGFTSGPNGIVTLHRLVGSAWQPVDFDMDSHEILTHADSGQDLIVLGPKANGKPRPVVVMDPVTKEIKGSVLEDKAYDFGGWFFRDPATRLIVGAQYDRDGPAVLWFDPEYQALQKALDTMFKGLVVRVIGIDEGRSIVLVRTFSDRQPSVYHIVDLKNMSVGLFKAARPWIDSKRMRPMNILRFKTRDGRSLDAYLTLPEGASKTSPAPLVVLPHGGPFARDYWEFNDEVQFLASRGYAVLQPNYRGSTGYSWQFTQEEEWDFVKMHEDVTDALKTSLKTGFIDSGRVAIMGSSFGGYLALCGVTKEPGMYRCAITNVGVFDWAQMIKDSKYDQYDSPRYASLMRFLGDPEKAAEKFAAISPIHQIGQVKVPVFVAHGKEDANVSVIQSRRLLRQLEKFSVPYEKMIVSGEGHGMGKLSNQVELYERIEAFLAKNLAP